jgi:16S rRNA (cytosine967-C5)-methyltransferase
LRIGGIIGYATCSPHLAETKWQIRDFLKRHPIFKRIAVAKDSDEDGDMQLWTYKDDTDCMYLSLLRKES